MVEDYIPKQKDIILMDLGFNKGHEQNGYRPAVVISNNVFNKFAHMIVVLPITSNTKDFPTHYNLLDTKKVSGSVLCEHVRSIDYDARKIKFVEKMSDKDFLAVFMLFTACFEE